MYHFPYLESLAEKNKHCRALFPSFSTINESDSFLSNSSSTRHNFQRTSCDSSIISGKDYFQSDKFKHWKKLVQAKFERENEARPTEQESNDKGNQIATSTFHITSDTPVWSFGSTLQCSYGTQQAECKICEKSFTSRRLLNQHKTFAHFSPRQEKEFCYLPYFSEPGRSILPKRQVGQKDCARCKKWLGGVKSGVEKYLEDLQTKGNSATVEEPKNVRKCKSMARRVCELCSKILSNRKGLERHMLIHTGEKPFPCDVCGKPFRRKDNCVRHKKTAHLFKKPRKPRRRRNDNNILISS